MFTDFYHFLSLTESSQWQDCVYFVVVYPEVAIVNNTDEVVVGIDVLSVLAVTVLAINNASLLAIIKRAHSVIGFIPLPRADYGEVVSLILLKAAFHVIV